MKKKILILVSILVVFLAIPPFVNYWVSTPSSIGFIPIEKQEVWISFYASLIGSVINNTCIWYCCIYVYDGRIPGKLSEYD